MKRGPIDDVKQNERSQEDFVRYFYEDVSQKYYERTFFCVIWEVTVN